MTGPCHCYIIMTAQCNGYYQTVVVQIPPQPTCHYQLLKAFNSQLPRLYIGHPVLNDINILLAFQLWNQLYHVQKFQACCRGLNSSTRKVALSMDSGFRELLWCAVICFTQSNQLCSARADQWVSAADEEHISHQQWTRLKNTLRRRGIKWKRKKKH